MQDQTAISQRRACCLVGLSRSVLSYRSAKQRSDARLQGRLRELAAERKRFGYRRLHVLLRREGYVVNHKKVYRLYREADLAVRRRKRRRGLAWAADEVPRRHLCQAIGRRAMSLAGEPSQPTRGSSAIPPSLSLADHRRLRSTRLAGAGALPEPDVPSDAGFLFRGHRGNVGQILLRGHTG